MYIYYILRGTQAGQFVELEGEINAESFPGIELDEGPAVINSLMGKLRSEGTSGEWEECDLTDSFFNREDNYVNYNGRWMRRSDTPWRKDRNSI